MDGVKHFSLVKPTIQTPFQIDFTWWKEHDNNWRVFLQSYLCAEHQKAFSDMNDTEQSVDWVDPETAEIQQVDGLQQILIMHCAKQPDFLTEHTALVDAIFRLLLANGNSPLTPAEMSSQLGRPADTILKILSSPQVYKGIRPRQAETS
ncbi:MAG: hypothetical protein M1281_17450 [Chloroflexi bacterium]|nr:hypothetical protein [Chloroflexota bacterium]